MRVSREKEGERKGKACLNRGVLPGSGGWDGGERGREVLGDIAN